jgi:hypothetical protein
MKKHYFMLIITACTALSYTTSKLLSNPNCPTSYTGAPKATTPNLGQVKYCTNSGCHTSFAINTSGSVVATGLPSGTYIAGQAYNFSITIQHSLADRSIWGFSIKAVNTVDNKLVGTFTTTNSNATLKGSVTSNTAELSHSNAPITAATSSYTFNNLKWTAPAILGTNDATIKFYIVGNAGDNDGSEAGDYIYSTTLNATLGLTPISLSSFTVSSSNNESVKIQWQTQVENNASHFEIESSNDGFNWKKINQINAVGNSITEKNYQYLQKNTLQYNATIFYRLKMVDKDGAFTLSAIKQIQLKNNSIVLEKSWAQPLQKEKIALYTLHSNGKNIITINVTNAIGQAIYRKQITLNNGVNNVLIPFNTLVTNNGVYYIQFANTNFNTSIQQIIN